MRWALFGDVSLAAVLVGTPFIAAALIAIASGIASGRRHGRVDSVPAILSLASAIVSALLVAWLWVAVPLPLFWRIPWIEPLGIGIGLFVDELSLLFAVLVVGVSSLSILYSLHYIPHDLAEQNSGGGETAYYASMLLFTGAMLGLLFAADLIQLYVFWELTGIASFLLIGLHWRDPSSRHGAVKTLLFTGIGGLALLLGAILMGSATDTYAIPTAIERSALLHASAHFGIVLVLIVVAAATKSAQVPFHVWLPDAMVAPTPVSAFLHSAAVVAAGVYLLARLHPVFAESLLWQWTVTSVGLASMAVGAVLALTARRLKEILAYSTISQYGFMFTLLGYATSGAFAVAMFSFFQHGMIKAALFFAAGAVTYATGARAIGAIGGLWTRLPGAFVVTSVLALSLAGVPPLAGFWMKEGFIGATLEAQGPAVAILGLAISALTLVYMLRFVAGAFVRGTEAPDEITPPTRTMLAAPVTLALSTVVFGLFPGTIAETLIQPATRAALGAPAALDLSLRLDLKLVLSVLALASGALAFVTYDRWSGHVAGLSQTGWSLNRLYIAIGRALIVVGALALRLQNGLLVRYVYLTMLGLVGLVVLAGTFVQPALLLPAFAGIALPRLREVVDVALAVLLILVAIGAILTFILRRHVHVILALSAVGYIIAGIFAIELAPDVGLVQVHVETLVTVLFILALVLIPRRIRDRLVLAPRERVSLGMIAAAMIGGLGSAWLSLLAIEHPPVDPVALWYTEHAPEFAEASDVVAAILVDFRALDTLGEITVFAIAAIGIFALVRLIRGEAA